MLAFYKVNICLQFPLIHSAEAKFNKCLHFKDTCVLKVNACLFLINPLLFLIC